jgi:hypothetical protein
MKFQPTLLQTRGYGRPNLLRFPWSEETSLETSLGKREGDPVVTRFSANTDLSDSQLWTASGYVFPLAAM